MRHPFEFIPLALRGLLFFTLLILTLILFAVFQYIDRPLRTPAAPNGIVSFELAATPDNAWEIILSWRDKTHVYASSSYTYTSPVVFAAFGLGIDYLFMPIYASTLALSTLLASGRHKSRLLWLGVVAGWGALAAPFFDAIENYALLRILLGSVVSPHPEIAAACAALKFVLIFFAVLYSMIGWILPRQTHI
jgi:hypothetical protein